MENITNGGNYIFDMNPVIFTKVSMSFLALYNTTFARNMAIYLEKISQTQQLDTMLEQTTMWILTCEFSIID